MNNAQRSAALSWLLAHAHSAQLPDHVDAAGRAYAIRLLTAAISINNIRAESEQTAETKAKPEKLAEIKQGTLEGEYRGNN